ncbi:M56 family metallopeptidase [Paenibacillus chartarius]|uniref:M56 family metallopeptidase n=1 Tax=Paenibacillus chartarius TaxID=747481 RepID=A0ABV6DRQ6_9BACL
MDGVVKLFLWYLDSTAAASAVALLVLAIQAVFRRYLSVRVRHAMWMVVLLRLLLPVFPDSQVSIFNAGALLADVKHAMTFGEPQVNSLIPQELMVNGTAKSDSADAPAVRTDGETESSKLNLPALPNKPEHPAALQAIAALWLGGAGFMLLYLAGYTLHLRRKRASLRMVADTRILAILDACRDKFNVAAPIRLYTGTPWNSPYIWGLTRPRIYVPEAICKELSAEQLFHIFSHELAHYKRRDIAWNAIGGVVLAVHWLNPLVWLCIGRMKADRELACDAYVLEVLGEAEAVPYGLTILEFLKRIPARRNDAHLIYFFGSDPFRQFSQRMKMIQTFKKGSYKLSAAAIVCVALLSMATLTDAARPAGSSVPEARLEAGVTSIMPSDTATDRVLYNSAFRNYNNLEKAVKVAGLKFKVPTELPAGYSFSEASFQLQQGEANARQMTLLFNDRNNGQIEGSFFFTASAKEGGLEAAVAEAEQNEKKRAESEPTIRKELVDIAGQKVTKITSELRKARHIVYLWQEQDIVYVIRDLRAAGEQTVVRMIASMAFPDPGIYTQYVSDDMLNVMIYDTGDLRQVPKAIGFAPKFPLELPGSYKVQYAMNTQKVNFSYPTDAADQKTRLLYTVYRKADNAEEKAGGITVMQIKDNRMTEDIQAKGFVGFFRIDGKQFEVKTAPVTIGGVAAFKTEPYKIDGALSSPNERDLVSYFWKENVACFQAVFPANVEQQEQIVAFLMKEKAADLERL